jgi:hypothetical protein
LGTTSSYLGELGELLHLLVVLDVRKRDFHGIPSMRKNRILRDIRLGEVMESELKSIEQVHCAVVNEEG